MNPSAAIAASSASANISSAQNKMSNRPVGVDLFCGVGGMSLGFEQAGFDVVAAVDIENINIETHKENFPGCKAWCADLSLVSGDKIREHTGIGDRKIDVVFSGPPCQGFSLIGKRDQEDPRNQLLLHLARLVIELSPAYFVVENVEGILLGKAKRVLEDFLERIRLGGYSVVQPIRVLDAAEFGVPQKRRRVFVLGYQRGRVAPVYPRPSHPYSKNGEVHRPTVWDAIRDLPKVAIYQSLLTMDEYHGELGEPSDYATILRGEARDPEDRSLERSTNGNGLTGCLRTVHTRKTIRRFKKTKPGSYEPVSRFHRLAKNGLANTIRAGTGPAQGSFMAPRPIHPFQDRCITVREAARLHSFPDWFHFDETKWHGFRQIGNSVPPLLARAVAKSIRKTLDHQNQKG